MKKNYNVFFCCIAVILFTGCGGGEKSSPSSGQVPDQNQSTGGQVPDQNQSTEDKDTTKPVIALLGKDPERVVQGGSYQDAGATAQDDVDGDITVEIKVKNHVNTMEAGDYEVVYSVQDTAGNKTEIKRTVTVSSTEIKKPWNHGKLKAVDKQRMLQHKDGTPFFWLADTAWYLSHKLIQGEIDTYLTDRQKKGFSVILMSVVQNKKFHANLADELPFIDTDFTKPNEKYWKNIDDIIKKAETLGMYMGLLPSWNMTLDENNTGLTSVEEATTYGKWIANRYKDQPNIIWVNGGDSQPPDKGLKKDIWNALGRSIHEVIKDNHLMTFHSTGPAASKWFDNEKWFAFDTIQTGHCEEDNRAIKNFKKYVVNDKILIDIEPRYENFAKCIWNKEKPEYPNYTPYRYTAKDVRKIGYIELFLGGAGYTYGHNAMYGFYKKDDDVGDNVRELSWEDALNTEGVKQMTYLNKLMKSRPLLNRTPDQSMVTSGNGTAIRGDGYAFVYLVEGGSVTVDLSKVASNTIKASWYDPTTGETTDIGEFNTTSHRFDSNGDEDVILILDDKNRGYLAPQ